jgi:hypothetical protein
MSTIVPLAFWHKLNYFLFCQTFEKLCIICVEIFNKIKISIVKFEPQTFKDDNLKLR